MARAYDLPTDPGMNEEFDFRGYAGQVEVEVGPFRVEPIPVEHPVPAYGLRISANGATIGYSGDTGPCEGLDAVATDVDLLLAEASFVSRADNPTELHLTGAECGEAATHGRSKRLVLTHVPPWHDPHDALAEARTTYAGDIALAHAGAVYDL